VDNLEDFNVIATYLGGVKAAEEGRPLIPFIEAAPLNNFNARPKSEADFAVKVAGSTINVITVSDGQLVTGRLIEEPLVVNGYAISDPGRDILKIAVVNRYEEEAPPAVGFVQNFGLKRGAMASSIAHDSHNIVAVGCDDGSICRAVNLVIKAKGGLAALSGSEELVLPLPVAGLMTGKDGLQVAREYQALDAFVKALGSKLSAPFMTLSFMALLVIPSLKLSDRGLFDGDAFGFIGVFNP